MSNEQVIVHYILHNNMTIDKDFAIDNPQNLLLGSDLKIQILGKLNKHAFLSEIRTTYGWKTQQISFLKRSSLNTNTTLTPSIQNTTESSNQLNSKFQLVNNNGQNTIKLMEIFDYNAAINALSKQKDPILTQFSEFYLVHLFNTVKKGQMLTMRKISRKSDEFFLSNNGKGIQLFSNQKIDQMSKQIQDRISKTFGDQNDKISKLIEEEQAKVNTVAPNSTGSANTVNPNINSAQTNPPQSNPNTLPQGPVKFSINPKSTTTNDKLPDVNPSTTLPISIPSQQTSEHISTKKSQKNTTKQEIESTLRLAKVTHRSFHNNEEIKQRSIVDFSNSKIDLINAYKNFFYEKEVILKDEVQAKYLKESLNTIEFNLDVGAPSTALDTKIGMAMMRSNTVSQENYLHNESFSQVHIAYSFQEAFQIEPENIMLNINLRNSFKKIFMFYLLRAKTSPNEQNFFAKSIQDIPQIKEQLEIFFKEYGSELETGVYVFGGKYMAETSFKFLENLDLKSKEKVRNIEGKFTIEGGYFSLKPGVKSQNTQKEQNQVTTENAIVSRSYILFPGSSKNLTEWNSMLDNSRQDWKLILKDTKKIFIGEILENSLNSEEYRLIDSQAFKNFTKKLREYFEEASNKNTKKVNEELLEYKRNRLFVLWKEEIIKTLRVIKLTPLTSNQSIRETQKPKIQSKEKTTTERRLISEEELKDMNKETKQKTNGEQNKKNEKIQQKDDFTSKQPASFYILLRSKEINQAYKSVLGDSSEYEQSRQIYDSRIERFFFKYICCCYFEKKPQLTPLEIKRIKYMKLFSDQQNQKLVNHSDLEIYNMEIEQQFKNLRQVNDFKQPSQIISCSSKIKHIFDISYQNFNEGLIENLIFRTVPQKDCLNRSQRFEIYFSMEFIDKSKGLVNLLQNGQQEHVVIRVNNIRKVNLVGEVIQDNVKQFGGLFFNTPNHEHFMLIEKLTNIGH